MKRFFPFFLIFVIAFLSGCSGSTNESSSAFSMQSYREIPGITEEEINAIEALKVSRKSFSYGTMLSTEAFLLSDETHAGFTINFCKHLSELFGIEFRHEIHEWEDLIAKLDDHSLDFVGELTQTEERMHRYYMTHPIAERFLRIFRHINAAEINSEMDISGLTIGFLEDSITADTIKKTYPYLQFHIVEVPDYGPAARMIENGEIDIFIDEAVADPSFEEYEFIYSVIGFPMIHEPVSMTTANPELAPVISAVNKYIASGGVDRLYEFYKDGDFEYARYKLQRSLTNDEKTYIANLQRSGVPIAVAFEADNYPVNFYNDNEEQFQGIAADVLTEISRLLDIEFRVASQKDAVWADIYEQLLTGTIPMAAELLQSEERKDHFIWGAAPYSRSQYAIMSRADFPNLASYQILRYSVGVMRKSGHEDTYRKLFPNNDNLVEYDSIEECLEALENGDVDLLMASEHMLIMQTHYREKPGLKINLRLNEALDSYFGYNKNEKLLCSIIDKAQAFVQTDLIQIGWTDRAFDYSKKLAEERSNVLISFISVLLLLITVMVVLLVWLIRLSRKLRNIASHDALTGILNRRYFFEVGLPHIERSSRLKKECYLGMFDLDHFKLVNDTYGHQAGDKVLKDIAQRVKKSIRTYDVLARYGGEEFVLLMFDTEKQNAINAVDRIRQTICKTPVEYEGKQIDISASFGMAYVVSKTGNEVTAKYPDKATYLEVLEKAIKHADEALYQAKETGRNKVVFYEAGMGG